jgi:cysteine desulfurase/selenocysteine lyase
MTPGLVNMDKSMFSDHLNVMRIRKDFSILGREIHPGVPLVYLDSAATSQKPEFVLNAVADFYRQHNANIHRAVHTLAVEATEAYETARRKVAGFIGAARPQEIIFTRNATESINLVTHSWGRHNLKAGDIVVLSELEHHANLVPWQILSKEIDIQLEFIPITDEGELDLVEFDRLLQRQPKIVSVTHMSNVLGTITPIREIIQKAHLAGAKVLVDAAQSAPHMPTNVVEMDADFFVLSAHKMCGPTGIGVLYGKYDLLNAMPPFLGGGEMIRTVEWRNFEPNELPQKFEAGTPAIAEAVGLGAAIDYLGTIGLEHIHHHEQMLAATTMERMKEIPGITIFGPSAEKRGGIVAFSMDGIHPHDVAQILDSLGVAVRAGHHCAMPLHGRLGISATTRASYYLYNLPEEVDVLIKGIRKAKKIFGS